jgi:hypothetical protein
MQSIHCDIRLCRSNGALRPLVIAHSSTGFLLFCSVDANSSRRCSALWAMGSIVRAERQTHRSFASNLHSFLQSHAPAPFESQKMRALEPVAVQISLTRNARLASAGSGTWRRGILNLHGCRNNIGRNDVCLCLRHELRVDASANQKFTTEHKSHVMLSFPPPNHKADVAFLVQAHGFLQIQSRQGEPLAFPIQSYASQCARLKPVVPHQIAGTVF